MSERIVRKRAASGHRPPPPRLAPAQPSVVLRRWPESTVVILGSGPSLTQPDVDLCCGAARVIAVNNTYALAPWADALYACDSRWWHWHKGVTAFTGQKYSIDERVKRPWPDITVLKNTGEEGLELKPSGLRTGKNGGYQAINLAVHLGARTILLLGFDMCAGKDGRSHYFGEHPLAVPPPFKIMIPKFQTLVEPLRALGVRVVNCSRVTALTAFERVPLADALQQHAHRQEVA